MLKKTLTEFRDFVLSGNIMDLAIGFIVGAAFAKIIGSFAENLVMSTIAHLVGLPNYSDLKLCIINREACAASDGAGILYGNFLTDFLGFAILAACLFGIVKMLRTVGMQDNMRPQRECPVCREFVMAQATKCRHCHSELTPEEPEVEDSNADSDSLLGASLATVKNVIPKGLGR